MPFQVFLGVSFGVWKLMSLHILFSFLLLLRLYLLFDYAFFIFLIFFIFFYCTSIIYTFFVTIYISFILLILFLFYLLFILNNSSLHLQIITNPLSDHFDASCCDDFALFVFRIVLCVGGEVSPLLVGQYLRNLTQMLSLLSHLSFQIFD